MQYRSPSPVKFQVKPEPGQIVKVYYPNKRTRVGVYESVQPSAFGLVVRVKHCKARNREIVLLKELERKCELNEVNFFLESTVCSFIE